MAPYCRLNATAFYEKAVAKVRIGCRRVDIPHGVGHVLRLTRPLGAGGVAAVNARVTQPAQTFDRRAWRVEPARLVLFQKLSSRLAAVVALAHACCDGSAWLRAEKLFSGAHARSAVLALALTAGACTVGPDYHPDAAPTPTHFKELKGWKVATPSDNLPRGDWWGFYRDQKLHFLIKQVEISNQTVLAEAAAYEQARAVIREAQAQLFPTFTGAIFRCQVRSCDHVISVRSPYLARRRHSAAHNLW